MRGEEEVGVTARPVPLPAQPALDVVPGTDRPRQAPVAVEPASDDAAYLRAARDGDATAFGMLVRIHQRRAYGIARAIVLTHEDAEDAVQEGFLHAYRAMARFDAAYPFGAWLARIVANAALDLVRRRPTQEIPATVALPFSDPAERSELRARLSAALAELPPRQRAVLVLHDVEGYRHAEIGGMLGVPEGTARSDLHHARVAMRRALDDLRTTS